MCLSFSFFLSVSCALTRSLSLQRLQCKRNKSPCLWKIECQRYMIASDFLSILIIYVSFSSRLVFVSIHFVCKHFRSRLYATSHTQALRSTVTSCKIRTISMTIGIRSFYSMYLPLLRSLKCTKRAQSHFPHKQFIVVYRNPWHLL